MSERRFTDKFEMDPGAVFGLAASHPAMLENRTLFPTTVVDVTKTAPDRLLISGQNNRKLGATVEKGRFKGYALYQLSLEERATCPVTCDVRDACYGNGMQMTRRHRIKDPDVFFARLEAELQQIAATNTGVLVRLHVLGDFPSVDYVAFWKDMLDEYENVAAFGYTHRPALVSDGDEVGVAIAAVKRAHPLRFRIRWSAPNPVPDGASVIAYVPTTPTVAGNPVCPAQTDATACCATCGFCWENADKTVLFMKHGRPALQKAADPVNAAGTMSEDQVGELRDRVVKAGASYRPLEALGSGLSAEPTKTFSTRPIVPVSMPAGMKANSLTTDRPDVRMVKLTDMRVETAYQRDLSNQSIKLIRRIISNWDWSKFKPPICAEMGDGHYFVVDGQHTAIAAASHPQILALPCVIINAPDVSDRAAAFVSHNMDRVRMTVHQLFYGRVAAQDKVALSVQALVERNRGMIPKHHTKADIVVVGEIIGIGTLEDIFVIEGEEAADRIVRVIIRSGFKPAAAFILRALRLVFCDTVYRAAAAAPDDVVIASLKAIGPTLDVEAGRLGGVTAQAKYRAGAQMIAAEITRRQTEHLNASGRAA